MELSYIDSHAHLDFESYVLDRDELLNKLSKEKIGVINPATDLASNEAIDHLARENPLIWGTQGLHPTDVTPQTLINLPAEIDRWKRRIQTNRKLVAIGEIGLDYFRQTSGAETQKSALRQMLTFALEQDLPVIFHCRDAYGDLLTILSDYPAVKGVIHCFSGNLEQAENFIKLGLYISFTGILTYPKNDELRSVATKLDMNKILIETDSPFLAPQSVRGERNDPTQVRQVADELARVRGTSLTEVARVTTENAKKLFKLK